jgi:K+-transporting ATPase KdpF subunit
MAEIIVLITGIALVVYLFFVIIRPEKFKRRTDRGIARAFTCTSRSGS